MGLFTNEFIDIIEWVDDTPDTLVWKFPRFQDEIKQNAKLTVRESQQAVFMNEGKIADVYQPGLYSLQTENMPILATLKGWKYGFNSPFKADVFFVSTRQFVDQKWGTKNALTLNDDRFGMFELRAFGTFAFRVVDGGKFLKEVAGTNTTYTTEDINGQLRSLIISKFSNAVGASGFPIEKFAGNLDELSKLCTDTLNADFDAYGLQVTRFLIENVSMPDDIKKEIFEYSRLNKIDMQKLTQFKAANSIQDAAQNEGIGGAGMGIGVGLGMGKIVTDAMAGGQNALQTPPPLAQFYIAVNGQQTGPFSMQQLAQMAMQGELKRESLVWKAGMANWENANTVAEIAQVFNNVPPPPPPPAV